MRGSPSASVLRRAALALVAVATIPAIALALGSPRDAPPAPPEPSPPIGRLVDPVPGAVDPDVSTELDLAANVESLRGEPFERVLMTLEHRQEWREIAWRKGLGAALDDGRSTGKPIAVVMMLSEYGQTSSPFS